MTRTNFLLLACCMMLLASCNTQFNRKWNEAGKTSPPAGRIEGRWEGTWHSVGTGHTGTLRCVVGPATNAAGDHPFTYGATWWHLLSGSFETTHRVKRAGRSFVFHGTHEMPAWAGGTYTYDGAVKDGRFHASYTSTRDHGSFDMTRPTRP